MELSLVTVALDPARGEFPERPLAGIEGELVSVVEHFFFHDGAPRLLLVVQHRRAVGGPGAQPRADRKRARRPDPRVELAEHERPLYDALRAWRQGRAQAEGVPPYVLLTNRQIADIARRRPEGRAGLREIEGIGEAKATKLGGEVLRVVGELTGPPGSADAPAPASPAAPAAPTPATPEPAPEEPDAP